MYGLQTRFAGSAARKEDAGMTHLRRARVAALVAVPVLAVAGGFAIRSLDDGPSARTKAALQKVLATPGQAGEAGEASLTAVERYWQTRFTYPTGRFDQRWVRAAARQAKRIKAGVPKGSYRPWRGHARLYEGTFQRPRRPAALRGCAAARAAAAGEHRLPGAVLHIRPGLRPCERDRVRSRADEHRVHRPGRRRDLEDDQLL